MQFFTERSFLLTFMHVILTVAACWHWGQSVTSWWRRGEQTKPGVSWQKFTLNWDYMVKSFDVECFVLKRVGNMKVEYFARENSRSYSEENFQLKQTCILFNGRYDIQNFKISPMFGKHLSMNMIIFIPIIPCFYWQMSDPWEYRRKRAVMTRQEKEDYDIRNVILLEALGNARLDESYDYILSHINSTNSPWIKRAGCHALRKYHHQHVSATDLHFLPSLCFMSCAHANLNLVYKQCNFSL